MMKVIYSEMDTPAGMSCRLEAVGHAGYAPAGQDIVCAGASTVMQGLVYLMAGEENARSDAFDETDGPHVAVQADAPCAEWVQGAFELAKACFVLLSERYPENVRFALLLNSTPWHGRQRLSAERFSGLPALRLQPARSSAQTSCSRCGSGLRRPSGLRSASR